MSIKHPTIYPLLFCLTAAASAQTIFNIDLNTVDGDAGTGWNVYAAPTDVNGSTLTTSTNAASAVTLSANGNLVDSLGSNLSNAVNRPSWVPVNAGDDFFWTDNNGTGGGESFTLIFGGFRIGNEVSLDIFASRSSSASVFGNYKYSLDGGTNWFGFDVLKNDGTAETANGWGTNDTQSQTFHINNDGYDNGRYMNMADVTLTGTTLQIRATETTLDDAYIGINAMRLTVIPEPNNYALLAGVLGMSYVMLRRHQA